MIRKHKFVHIKKMCLLMLLILATFIAVMPMANAAYNQSDINVVRNINGLNLESDPFWWDTGIVTWSEGNPQRIIELNISGKGLVGNLNVTGLERLEYLDCSGNRLTSLNVTNNSNLLFLLCGNNQLTNLNVTNNVELRVLLCSNNKLESLNVEKNEKLVILTCHENQLPSLNLAANTELETLLCGDNSLTGLDVMGLVKLTELYCNDNQLTVLDVTKNTKLIELICSNNKLGNLDVTKLTDLTALYCSGNQLQNLNLEKNTKLIELVCGNNKLESLDVTKLTDLTVLYCNNNQLQNLNLEKNTKLTEVYCNDNQLTVLDVTKNTKLRGLICSNNKLARLDLNKELIGLACNNNQLISLDVTKNLELKGLDCSDNQLESLDVTQNTKLEELYAEDQVITLPPAVSNKGYLTIPNPIQYNGNLMININGAKVNGDNIEWSGLAETSGNAEFTFSQLPDPKINGAGFTGKVIQSYVSENTDTYTVAFNSDGGTSIQSQTINSGSLASNPANPIKSGYTFVEWRLNGAAYNFNTPVTSNLTLVAVYTAVTSTNYTVVFNSDGGSIPSQTVNSGGVVIQPANPVKSNYIFVEWQLNGVAYNFSSPVTSNLTLVAVYTAVTPATNYTVTFNSDGGTSIQSQTINSGGLVSKPSNPVKSGYTFVEWRLNGSAYNFNAPVTSNLTLVAIYQTVGTATYTVTFNTTSGIGYAPSQKVNSGSLVTKPSDPFNFDGTFVEWQLNGIAYDFSTPVTSNMTLVAVYEPTYTVTFNTTSGIGYVPSQKVNNGSLVTKPSDPFNFNGTFVEWQLNGTAYNFSTPVTSNLTLVAVYR